ncbi:hypothetical protein [Polymorphospora sp. NPDC050346]|uniref:ATP-grasp domain-containing protein n=1 Tax=Polymorphospora sp. NPDC050346 TaxID=3155780 RepID=UPI0033C15F04
MADEIGRRQGRRALVDQVIGATTRVDLQPAERSSWLLPRAGAAGDALPCVVLADSAGLGEFRVLQRQLSQLGVPSMYLDTRSIVEMSVTAGADDGLLVVNGCRIAPVVAWIRHFTSRGIPRLRHPGAAMFRADSWCAMVHELTASAPVNLPGGGALGRLEQLTDAARAGLLTPRTMVTTDLESAATSLSSERIVVKAVGEHFVEIEPGLLVYALPEIVRRSDLASLAPLDLPVIAQEYIDHDRELRIYYLYGDIHTFEVVKDSPDAPWRDPSAVTVTPTAAPADVAEAVRVLADAWSLTYGAFDILTADEAAFFLEVNPHGDWRWFESAAGVSHITDAAAAMVRTLYQQALGGAPQPPAVELVDFLLMRGER